MVEIPAGETDLARMLKDRIRAAGPLSFHDFMEAALYEPGHGYYARGPDIGPSGDFSTSVRFEAFRLAVFRFARAAWLALGSPDTFRVVELGGGTGQLATTVTQRWRTEIPQVPLEYVTVDASPGLRAKQAAVPGVRSVASTRDMDAGMPTLVFGNEVLDALPLRRVMGARDGSLLEVHVDVGATGRFRERLLPLADDALERRFARLGLRPQPNQIVDVAPALEGFVADAARLADPGFLCFVDYGDPAEILYAPTRLNGTLAAYRAHGRFFDPYERVGEQDLTADVDFTTVTHAAEDAGLEALGYTTQGEWLEALGVGDLGTEEEVRTLASPASLGTAFHVLLFRRGTRATLPGF